jgi:hypothetical protein
MRMITKLDFVGVPSTDSERTRAFYVHSRYAPLEQSHSDEGERGA